MTDVSLAIVLPLLGAFLLPLVSRILRWFGAVFGPALLALSALILFVNWSTFETPYAIAVGGFQPPLGIALYIDTMALLFALSVPLMTLLLWPAGSDAAAIRRQSLTLLLAASLTGIALSGDLFNIYVFYELAAVASYGLIAGGANAPAFVAAFRYLVISALGSVVTLIGIALIYFTTGTLNLAHLATLSDQLASPQGVAAFAMLLIGFGVKAELFPVNGWVPEVYATTSKRVAALLAGLASKLAVLAIVRILLLVFPGDPSHQLLLILGIAGIIAGELAALQARDLTRMLAWSSVGQLGVVFVAFSLPGATGVIAGVVVAMHHLVVKSALFLLADRWGGAIDKLKGSAAASPLAAAMIVLFSLSLLGVPPLPGFWSKYLVLSGLAASGSTAAFIAMAVVLLATVVEGVYLMRVISTLYRGTDGVPLIRQRSSMLLGSSLLALALIVAGVLVDPLWQQLDRMATSAADVPAYVQTVLGGNGVKP